MKTIISIINPNNIDTSVIEQAASIIQNGGIVAFPTETVYGLGGDALNPESSAKIYEAKGRPSDNPLIVHIADIDKLPAIVSDIPKEAKALTERFWPGPLTIILGKSDIVPYKTTGGLDTVAVRYPSDPVAQAFIRASGGYIAAPSANLSGKPSPTVGKYVIQDLDGRVDMIITGDDSVIGLESTIVDMTSDKPMILRPGYITYEELKEVIPEVCMDPALIHTDDPTCHPEGASCPPENGSCHPERAAASRRIPEPEQTDTLLHPKAPGMKYRHYAPNGSLVIVCQSNNGNYDTGVHEESSKDTIVSYINDRLTQDHASGLKTAVITTDERTDRYAADVICSTGPEDDPIEAAHRLFAILRKMDDEGVQSIYAEGMSESGIGTAYMNRLRKAAGGKIVFI